VSSLRTTEGEPHDRLTRIGARLIDAFDADPEKIEGDMMVICLDSEVERRGGTAVHGYEDTSKAIGNLFVHLLAMLKTKGDD